MTTTIKDLMREVDEAWDELRGLREGLKKLDEFIDALCEINTDYLYALKAVSDKYGGDFEIAAFAAISSLTKIVSTFGAEETFRALKEDEVDN